MNTLEKVREKKFTIFFLGVYIFLYPLLEGYSNDSHTPIGTKYLGFFLVFIWLMETLINTKIRFNNKVICLLLFCGWSACSILWSANYSASVISIMGYFQVFTLYFLIFDVIKIRETLVRLMSSYVLGIAMLSVSAVINIFTGSGFNGFENRFSAMGIDPNDFGITVTSSIPIAYFLFVEKKSKLSILYIILAIPIVIATSSRGAVVALSIIAIAYTFISLQSVKKTVFLTVTIAGLILLVGQFVPETALMRIGQSSADATGSGRTLIWEVAWNLGSASPWFGNGVGTFIFVSPTQTLTHNTFLSNWADLGIIGFGLWSILWILHFKKIITMKLSYFNDLALKMSLFFSLTVLLVGSLTLNWEIHKAIFIIWGFISVLEPNMPNESNYHAKISRKEQLKIKSLQTT